MCLFNFLFYSRLFFGILSFVRTETAISLSFDSVFAREPAVVRTALSSPFVLEQKIICLLLPCHFERQKSALRKTRTTAVVVVTWSLFLLFNYYSPSPYRRPRPPCSIWQMMVLLQQQHLQQQHPSHHRNHHHHNHHHHQQQAVTSSSPPQCCSATNGTAAAATSSSAVVDNVALDSAAAAGYFDLVVTAAAAAASSTPYHQHQYNNQHHYNNNNLLLHPTGGAAVDDNRRRYYIKNGIYKYLCFIKRSYRCVRRNRATSSQ